ncbi:MAG TPA: hypothetical protein VFM54_00570 [Micromonosporaceae bacterium]|nr:hypothetical protein [Micromonosporaceae bacterium]
MTTPASEIRLRLPQGWIEFDPRADDLKAELLRAVRDEWGAAPPPEAEEQLNRLLSPLMVELKRLSGVADIILVGLFVRVLAIEGEDLPLVLTANAVLALSPPDVGLDLARDEAPAGWTVLPVDLPSGRAVLMTGESQLTDPEWAEPVPARARRYVIPVPGTHRMATLAFLTPNLELAEAFTDVFDAVAESITFS